MAIEYRYDSEANLIRIMGDGTVSLEDRIQFARKLMDDATLSSSASILIDVNRIENAPTDDEVATIGLLIARLRARFRGRVAITTVVAGHVTLSHLVAFSVGQHENVRAFVAEAEALEWLCS